MNNILEKICLQKKIDLVKDKKKCSYKTLEKLFKKKQKRNFKELLVNAQLKKIIILLVK